MEKTAKREWRPGEAASVYKEVKTRHPEVMFLVRDNKYNRYFLHVNEALIHSIYSGREILLTECEGYYIPECKIEEYLRVYVEIGRRVAILEPLEACTSGRG